MQWHNAYGISAVHYNSWYLNKFHIIPVIIIIRVTILGIGSITKKMLH